MKNKDLKYRLFANLIFGLHVATVSVILFGWYFPSLYRIYLITLIATLISEIAFGYCIFTKWEFDLRKKIEPALSYDYTFVSYYVYKLFHINIPGKYVRYPATIFLVVSLFFVLRQII